MAKSETLKALAQLIHSQRWAALATCDEEGRPSASMVAYSPEPDLGSLLLHLSRLAAHTGYLLERPDVSLVIGEPDCDARSDPQTLGRVSILGTVVEIPPESAEFRSARTRYLNRLPEAEPRFDFADFVLFRLNIRELRYVGGFAAAHRFDASALRQIGAELSL